MLRKKIIFFLILGGARAGCAPPLDPPLNKVQTYSNVLSTPVKMFFNHLTAWLKRHRKKKNLNGKKRKKKPNKKQALSI